MRILKFLAGPALLFPLASLAATADALDAGHNVAVSWHPSTVGGALLATLAFGLVGIFLAIAGFKLFDAFTKFDLEKEICDNRNMAVAVLCGAMLLGICLIVAAAIVG